AKGQVYVGDELEEIAVRAMPAGSQILVKDVATVLDRFKEGNALSQFNGRPAAALGVYRVGDQDILDISRTLNDYVKRPSSYIPEGIKLDVWQDSSFYFKGRMDMLYDNAIGGLIIVFVI